MYEPGAAGVEVVEGVEGASDAGAVMVEDAVDADAAVVGDAGNAGAAGVGGARVEGAGWVSSASSVVGKFSEVILSRYIFSCCAACRSDGDAQDGVTIVNRHLLLFVSLIGMACLLMHDRIRYGGGGTSRTPSPTTNGAERYGERGWAR